MKYNTAYQDITLFEQLTLLLDVYSRLCIQHRGRELLRWSRSQQALLRLPVLPNRQVLHGSAFVSLQLSWHLGRLSAWPLLPSRHLR